MPCLSTFPHQTFPHIQNFNPFWDSPFNCLRQGKGYVFFYRKERKKKHIIMTYLREELCGHFVSCPVCIFRFVQSANYDIAALSDTSFSFNVRRNPRPPLLSSLCCSLHVLAILSSLLSLIALRAKNNNVNVFNVFATWFSRRPFPPQPFFCCNIKYFSRQTPIFRPISRFPLSRIFPRLHRLPLPLLIMHFSPFCSGHIPPDHRRSSSTTEY